MPRSSLLALLIPLLLFGCKKPPDEPLDPVATAPTASSAPAVASTAPLPSEPPIAAAPATPIAAAHIVLQPTQNSKASGDLTLAVEDGTLHLSGRVLDLTPGAEHGFHVHETGDCSAPDASSAGAHFNPTGAPHGPATGPHHAGDLPNLLADDRGQAEVNLVLHELELGTGGPNDVLGRALIVHSQTDDYSTQPSGNSGAPIACGVIERSDSMPAAAPMEPTPAEATPSDGEPPPPTDDGGG